MKLTPRQLRRIIAEEVNTALTEIDASDVDPVRDERFSFRSGQAVVRPAQVSGQVDVETVKGTFPTLTFGFGKPGGVIEGQFKCTFKGKNLSYDNIQNQIRACAGGLGLNLGSINLVIGEIKNMSNGLGKNFRYLCWVAWRPNILFIGDRNSPHEIDARSIAQDDRTGNQKGAARGTRPTLLRTHQH